MGWFVWWVFLKIEPNFIHFHAIFLDGKKFDMLFFYPLSVFYGVGKRV